MNLHGSQDTGELYQSNRVQFWDRACKHESGLKALRKREVAVSSLVRRIVLSDNGVPDSLRLTGRQLRRVFRMATNVMTVVDLMLQNQML